MILLAAFPLVRRFVGLPVAAASLGTYAPCYMRLATKPLKLGAPLVRIALVVASYTTLAVAAAVLAIGFAPGHRPQNPQPGAIDT